MHVVTVREYGIPGDQGNGVILQEEKFDDPDEAQLAAADLLPEFGEDVKVFLDDKPFPG